MLKKHFISYYKITFVILVSFVSFFYIFSQNRSVQNTIANALPSEVQLLKDPINSRYTEYSPVVVQSQLFFQSNRPDGSGHFW